MDSTCGTDFSLSSLSAKMCFCHTLLGAKASTGVRRSVLTTGPTMLLRACILLAVLGSELVATTYEVGPGKQYTAIGAVPWESLQPGDLVLIHWRSTPY